MTEDALEQLEGVVNGAESGFVLMSGGVDFIKIEVEPRKSIVKLFYLVGHSQYIAQVPAGGCTRGIAYLGDPWIRCLSSEDGGFVRPQFVDVDHNLVSHFCKMPVAISRYVWTLEAVFRG
jgi:hypothetical protein